MTQLTSRRVIGAHAVKVIRLSKQKKKVALESQLAWHTSRLRASGMNSVASTIHHPSAAGQKVLKGRKQPAAKKWDGVETLIKSN